jgi:hypothetical protein
MPRPISSATRLSLSAPRTVRVLRNFLHHNARAGLGYGVTIHANGFATILGNTFLYNRHAIAADGIAGTGYAAFDNLVLSDAPEYGLSGSPNTTSTCTAATIRVTTRAALQAPTSRW